VRFAALLRYAPVPHVSVRVAAHLAGKDRSTILRAIKSGVLTATKTELGRLLIDPAELERVYGMLQPAPVDGEALPEHAPDGTGAAVREVKLLREMLERERAHHEEVHGTYERDRRAWEEERAFMRGMLDKHTDQIKLLADQREERERVTAKPRPRLLARLFGRG
jgi:hypothetical protein